MRNEKRMGKRETQTMAGDWEMTVEWSRVFFYDKLGTVNKVEKLKRTSMPFLLVYVHQWGLSAFHSQTSFPQAVITWVTNDIIKEVTLFLSIPHISKHTDPLFTWNALIVTTNAAWHAVTHTLTKTDLTCLSITNKNVWGANTQVKGFKNMSADAQMFLKVSTSVYVKVHLSAKCCVCSEGYLCQGRYNPWGYTHKTFLWPTFHNKRRSGFRGTREEGDMNIIFWILEENIPHRPLYEYLMNLAFSMVRYSGFFGNIMAGST